LKLLKSKALPYIILVVIAVVVLFIRKIGSSPGNGDTNKAEQAGGTINRNRGFDRRTSLLDYTKHAHCRMECRQISESEVEEIMRTGSINYRKSEVNAKPCPTYALEGMTHDNQHVRIVFAQCDLKTKVVTTIDLEHDWPCHCPGDDKK
jgi:hypothetical protein